MGVYIDNLVIAGHRTLNDKVIEAMQKKDENEKFPISPDSEFTQMQRAVLQVPLAHVFPSARRGEKVCSGFIA